MKNKCEHKVITRGEAVASGLFKYCTGKPCHRGHYAERYVSSSTCIECRHSSESKLKQKLYDATPDRVKSRKDYYKSEEGNRKVREHQHNVVKFRLLARKYGISKTTWEEMILAVDMKCPICGVEFDLAMGMQNRKYKPVVDHDHITGKVRGMLCTNCNLMLGKAKDDILVVQKSIEYLTKHNV